jgi:carbonic anhydrase
MAHSRRHLLRILAMAGAGVALDTLGPRPAAAAEAAAAETGGTLTERLSVCRPGGDPLQELLRRNRDFSRTWQDAERSENPLDRATLLHETWPLHCQVRPDALAAGQRPWASVLCCADSRVAPEWIFACGAGELFEVRSAGNTAFDAGVASLEYAVAELAVPLILVMGHSGCGAVTAAMARTPLTPLLEELVAPIRANLQPGADLAQAVRRNAAAAAAALPRRSALLSQAVAEGRLAIQAAYFDIGSGEVSLV